MARIRAVLAALVTALRRDYRTAGSFAGNNLFVLGLTALFLSDRPLFAATTALIALILFVPLSADPLHVIPSDRWKLWPLSTGQRVLLRVLSPWLSPVTWLIVALAVWKRLSIGLFATLAGMFAIGFLLPTIGRSAGVFRHLPAFPRPLNHLIRKNAREMLATLDFWCAALVSISSFAVRAAGLLPRDAFLPLTILIVLSISTYSQALFGLDGPGGMTRYRLLPVSGWQILFAKDVPYLMICAALTVPLEPVAGCAAAMLTLAVGHYSSVTHHSDQIRWRFSRGSSFALSLLQIFALCGGAATAHTLPVLLIPATLIYTASTWWSGRTFDEQPL